MINRLNALNRDLTPEENLHGDSKDRNDWQEARRWLRDLTHRVTKYLKEHDIGETSGVGKRQWFEQTYQQFIAPRQQFDGLQPAQREFETYRKKLQTLLINMTNACSSAANDGERRAKAVLSKIAVKTRAAKAKR